MTICFDYVRIHLNCCQNVWENFQNQITKRCLNCRERCLSNCTNCREKCTPRCCCAKENDNSDNESEITEYSRGTHGNGDDLEMDEVEIGSVFRGRAIMEGFQTIHI